ncbi:MAG: pilin, partial [Moraxellaceae bacterium]
YATYQKRIVLAEAYDVADLGKRRVEMLYQAHKACPVGVTLSTGQQQLAQAQAPSTLQTLLGQQPRQIQLDILGQAAGITDSSCIVQTTIQGAVWPVQNLNGQRVSLYRLNDGRWRCVTSLGEREAPRGCEL